MSYPSIQQDDFMSDLLSRKEFYSLKIDPDKDFRNPATTVNLGPLADRYLKLHSHQLFVRNFLSPNTPYKRLHLLHGTGCHPAGTRVLDYLGKEKRVEDVRIGDYLLGDNGIAGVPSCARRVNKLLSGVDSMYQITLGYSNETFQCNHDHILTLKFDNTIVDVPLIDYLNFPPYVQMMARMYRIHSVRLPPMNIAESAYNAGLSANKLESVNPKFKYNSTHIQLGFINGVMSNQPEIISGCYEFIHDVKYMCRCLGMCVIDCSDNNDRSTNRVTNDNTNRSTTNDNTTISNTKYSISISDKELTEPFKIEYVGVMDYYGFTLNGNGRYVLDNFIITHNSGKTLAAVSIANEFINVYKRMYTAATARIGIGRRYHVELDRATPSVFVLGFSGAKGAFMRELLDFPEFGFI